MISAGVGLLARGVSHVENTSPACVACYGIFVKKKHCSRLNFSRACSCLRIDSARPTVVAVVVSAETNLISGWCPLSRRRALTVTLRLQSSANIDAMQRPNYVSVSIESLCEAQHGGCT